MGEFLLCLQIGFFVLTGLLGCFGIYDSNKRFRSGDLNAFGASFLAALVCVLFGGALAFVSAVDLVLSPI